VDGVNSTSLPVPACALLPTQATAHSNTPTLACLLNALCVCAATTVVAAWGWSQVHVDYGRVQPCGPVHFAVTAVQYWSRSDINTTPTGLSNLAVIDQQLTSSIISKHQDCNQAVTSHTMRKDKHTHSHITLVSVATGFCRHGMPPPTSNDTGTAFCSPN